MTDLIYRLAFAHPDKTITILVCIAACVVLVCQYLDNRKNPELWR